MSKIIGGLVLSGAEVKDEYNLKLYLDSVPNCQN